MAKVSLRIYNRDIESLVDQGHLDEAIAHCRHILRTFPKHLETYRLLGKAYLEAKRYDEAVEIFSRTLMAVPDDFVAHVGMSIIRDDQGKLDDAIWHMERAFECQPSNAAIQGELRRLFGRRDGVEPPKIRMTRGALAHMYVQGELYPQAISEIKAVLSQDPNRDDMKTLLARAYFHAGQKADASDICQQLLKKYPYSLDANRVMVELLQSSDSVETTQVYRHRVSELDPYSTFAQGSVFRSNEVSDAAISLERYTYTGQEADQAAWSATGIGLGGQAASQPEPQWLNQDYAAPAPSASTPVETPPAVPTREEEIPDFMREAGWKKSSGEPEQPVTFDETVADDDLAPADMPDWLKAMAPSEEARPVAPAQEDENLPEWLSGLGLGDAAPSAPAAPAAPEPSFQEPTFFDEPAPASDVPDWLRDFGEPGAKTPAVTADSDLPDWLLPESEESAAPVPQADKLSPPTQPRAAAAPEPLNVSAQEQDDAIAWLESLATKHGAKPEELVTDPNARKETPPDWVTQSMSLTEPEPAAPTPVVEEPAAPVAPAAALGASMQEQDDAIAWLESLATKHGAKPEELVTDPTARKETPPDWVTQSMSLTEPELAAPTPVVEEPAAPAALGASMQEQDDAIAWLESLATKHGAKPEELVTDPNARKETPPDWVTQSMGLTEPEPAAPTPVVEEPAAPVAPAAALGASMQEQDDAIAWLESLATKHGAKPEELVTDPNARKETPPDWVTQSMSLTEPEPADPTPVVDEPAAPVAPAAALGASMQEQDDAIAWLESLATKHGAKPEELVTDPNTRKETPPDWVTQSMSEPQSTVPPMPEPARLEEDETGMWLRDLGEPVSAAEESPEAEPVFTDSAAQVSDWLNALDADEASPEPAIQEEKPAVEAASLPDWLMGFDKAEAETPAARVVTDELPEWLREPEPSAQPEPTMPTDWHPVEAETETGLHFSPEPEAEQKPQIIYSPPLEPEPVAVEPTPPPTPAPEPEPAKFEAAPEPEFKPVEIDFKPEPPSPKPVRSVPAPKKAPARKPASTERQAAPARRYTGMLTPPVDPALSTAQAEMHRGDIPAALEHYGKLIRRGKWLEEIIRDLREALYRYPVEVSIWQALGDAYMRENRLQEALDAYTKAEELLR